MGGKKDRLVVCVCVCVCVCVYVCESSDLCIKEYRERLFQHQATLRIASDVMDELVNTKIYGWKYKCLGVCVWCGSGRLSATVHL